MSAGGRVGATARRPRALPALLLLLAGGSGRLAAHGLCVSAAARPHLRLLRRTPLPRCAEQPSGAPTQEGAESPAQAHRAGYISIVGMPNVGKSTLLNSLLGEVRSARIAPASATLLTHVTTRQDLAITTRKAQTTRHRLLGIASGDNWQIVYSDTPGVMEAQYKMHEGMMAQAISRRSRLGLILDARRSAYHCSLVQVRGSIDDADVLLIVVDVFQSEFDDEKVRAGPGIALPHLPTPLPMPIPGEGEARQVRRGADCPRQ